MADQASNTTEIGSIPISERALKDALNGILASSLRQVCAGPLSCTRYQAVSSA